MSSRAQQNLYRAMLRSISDQMAGVGCQWDEESWKRFLVCEFAKDVPDMQWANCEVFGDSSGCWWVTGEISTANFTNEQANLFIAWLDCWCAEREINLQMEKI